MTGQTRKYRTPKMLSTNLKKDIEKLEKLLTSKPNARLTAKQQKKQKQFAKQLLNHKKKLLARVNRTLRFANRNPVRFFSKNNEPTVANNTVMEPTVNTTRSGKYLRAKTKTRRVFSSNMNRKLWEAEKTRRMKQLRKQYNKQVAAEIAHNEHLERLAEKREQLQKKLGL